MTDIHKQEHEQPGTHVHWVFKFGEMDTLELCSVDRKQCTRPMVGNWNGKGRHGYSVFASDRDAWGATGPERTTITIPRSGVQYFEARQVKDRDERLSITTLDLEELPSRENLYLKPEEDGDVTIYPKLGPVGIAKFIDDQRVGRFMTNVRRIMWIADTITDEEKARALRILAEQVVHPSNYKRTP